MTNLDDHNRNSLIFDPGKDPVTPDPVTPYGFQISLQRASVYFGVRAVHQVLPIELTPLAFQGDKWSQFIELQTMQCNEDSIW